MSRGELAEAIEGNRVIGEQTILPTPRLIAGRSNLLLVGFSGSGKTAVGALVAQQLGLLFLDLDQIIERRLGLTVAEIFALQGEVAFRLLEQEVLEQAAQLSGVVVATGGGAVLHQPQFARLKATGLVVELVASPAELERRLEHSYSRPKLAQEGLRLTELLAERQMVYQSADWALDTTELTLEQVVAKLNAYYRAEVEPGCRLEVSTDTQSGYPVVVGEGVLEQLPSLLISRLPPVRRVMVVCDAAVAKLVGSKVERLLRAVGIEVFVGQVKAGEAAKQMGELERLWDQFQALGLDRGDLVVAVGGGAALDLIGFASATWARGIPWLTVPTTTLAMADASIGGKVGINRLGLKNAVGAFHNPHAVLVDPVLLGTLDSVVAQEGLAEIVKMAVLASPLLIELMEQLDLDESSLPEPLTWLLEQALRIKAAYVTADLREQGLRQALNLGHTYAHGIEAASDYTVPHGRAVAVGLLAAVDFGEHLRLLPPGQGMRLERLLRRLGLLLPLPPLDHKRIRAAMQGDKKRRRGTAVFLVPGESGVILLTGIDLKLALTPLWRRLSQLADLPLSSTQ